jgi:hypothetical protein
MRERPTGGLVDYRQVKPWKKRTIANEILLRKKTDGKTILQIEQFGIHVGDRKKRTRNLPQRSKLV